MVAAFVLCSAMMGQASIPARDPSKDFRAYQEVKARAGRTAEDQVMLALWCEARGLEAERLTHLTRAILIEPDNRTARGLLGQVSYKGKWMRPEEVQAAIENDPDAQQTLHEYLKRRVDADYTADAQQRLAQWCDQHGLKDQAVAHYKNVLRINPRREQVWRKLGYRKHEGRWMRPEDLAAETAEAEAQKHADRHWKPLLEKYREELLGRDRKKRSRAEEALAAITDPRAVPMIWAVFVRGHARLQVRAAEILARIDGPSASQAVARLAVFSDFPETRGRAAEILERRDPHDFLDDLIDLIRKPFRYRVEPVRDDGTGGGVFVEGEQFNVRRNYRVARIDWSRIPARLFTDDIPLGVGFGPGALGATGLALTPPGSPPTIPGVAGGKGRSAGASIINNAIRRDQLIMSAIVEQRRSVEEARERERQDVASIDLLNQRIRAVNERVLPLVKAVTGLDLGDDREAWDGWWNNHLGYAYQSPVPKFKPTYTNAVAFIPINQPIIHTSCFAAGTPVHTIGGPRPIESIEVGDRVLSQDVSTGAISYQPVLLVHHNAPSALLKLTIGTESLLATGIHRFWKVGKGWTMARDLKPGDVVRTLGGTLALESVEPAGTAPVFNLDVAENRDFFVGEAGFLVYDFSVVQPVAKPFDAQAVAARVGQDAH